MLASNHSVLISSLGMGFGHRNCVVVGGPNSGKRLNKWAKQTGTVHACLNGTQTCDCEPPFELFPFSTACINAQKCGVTNQSKSSLVSGFLALACRKKRANTNKQGALFREHLVICSTI